MKTKLFPVDFEHARDERGAIRKAHQLAGGSIAEFSHLMGALGHPTQGVVANDNGGYKIRLISGKRYETLWNPGGRREVRGVDINEL